MIPMTPEQVADKIKSSRMSEKERERTKMRRKMEALRRIEELKDNERINNEFL